MGGACSMNWGEENARMQDITVKAKTLAGG
jgi:hypothetical protein